MEIGSAKNSKILKNLFIRKQLNAKQLLFSLECFKYKIFYPLKKSEVVHVYKVADQHAEETSDFLAIEEPLEISLVFGTMEKRVRKRIAVTMRSPGDDKDLTLGFLFTEGIIQELAQVMSCKQLQVNASVEYHENLFEVALYPGVAIDEDRLERLFFTNSSCGICGKASIEAIRQELPPGLPQKKIFVRASMIHQLPKKLREGQDIFGETGGNHAAALFNLSGELLFLREDVGRHNALDKLIGASLLQNIIPLNQHLLFLSGRCSFELVQKAMMAGIRIIASVGAPSSLAVKLAVENDVTIIGFVRNNRFNVYCGKDKLEW